MVQSVSCMRQLIEKVSVRFYSISRSRDWNQRKQLNKNTHKCMHICIKQLKSLYAISINHVHLSTLMNELPNGIPHLPTLPKTIVKVGCSFSSPSVRYSRQLARRIVKQDDVALRRIYNKIQQKSSKPSEY